MTKDQEEKLEKRIKEIERLQKETEYLIYQAGIEAEKKRVIKEFNSIFLTNDIKNKETATKLLAAFCIKEIEKGNYVITPLQVFEKYKKEIMLKLEVEEWLG